MLSVYNLVYKVGNAIYYEKAIRGYAVKTKHPIQGVLYWVTKMGVSILGSFQDKPVFSHIIEKVSARAFLRCG